MNADASGRLVFGFHITAGIPPGSIELTVERAGGSRASIEVYIT